VWHCVATGGKYSPGHKFKAKTHGKQHHSLVRIGTRGFPTTKARRYGAILETPGKLNRGRAIARRAQ
jgi:hypothetical protein